MQYTQLGHTDLRVSRIAFGCMSTVTNPTYAGLEEQQGIDTIRAALDHGINFFDTAPGYGNGASEALLGRALRDVRDKVVIADKVNTASLSADDVYAECDKSLKLLQTDYIDLYQIHWPKNVVPMEETLGAMADLRKQGKVRCIGVCNFGPVDFGQALSIAELATNQVSYSLLHRAVEFDVQEMCVQHGVGILAYSPIAQGLLTGRFTSPDQVPPERARTRVFKGTRPQASHGGPGCEDEAFAAIQGVSKVAARLGKPMAQVALAWLLHQPAVLSVLAGASRPDQVASNAAAADLALSDADLTELDAATRPVKEALGANLDVWQNASRIK